MMFQSEHIEQIRTGEKTQTRRLWSDDYNARPSAGDVRMATPASEGPFVSHDEADCYIRVTRAAREPLGAMTEADAEAEGGYSLEEFRELWESMHGEGSWKDDRVVDVVRFEYAGTERPDAN